MVTPHYTEEYYCTKCKESKNRFDVDKTWICPVCGSYAHIRIITEDKDQACIRILPKDLKPDDYILMNRNDQYRQIFAVKELDDKIQLNVEKYGSWRIPKNMYVLKLIGGWYIKKAGGKL